MKKISAENCYDCPFRKYIGGPEECAVTKKTLTADQEMGRELPEWCPLREEDVTVSLKREKQEEE